MKMPEWSDEKLREIAKAEKEAGFIGCGDTPYNRAVHAIVQSKENETADFEEQADRIVMGEAINGERSWMQFAKDQTAKVLALESRNTELIEGIRKAVYMLGMLTDEQLRFRQPSEQTASEVFHELENLIGEGK